MRHRIARDASLTPRRAAAPLFAAFDDGLAADAAGDAAEVVVLVPRLPRHPPRHADRGAQVSERGARMRDPREVRASPPRRLRRVHTGSHTTAFAL